ncbi:MAG: T9SS type A sorting domain-containing protein [Candidatus Zixiibacteriota bacterium]|nr:MAG: T9SS type A sorting domain-containing protein [candidate division Zixibacteria bacterium]
MKAITITVVAMFSVALCLTALATDTESLERKKPGEPGEWSVPDCNRIAGTPAFTFTKDEGLTLTESPALRGLVYSYGLVALDEANVLLASTLTNSGTSILRSDNAGCRWSEIIELPVGELLLLTAAPGGMAYGWSRGRTRFYRIEGETFTSLAAPKYIYGLAVDPEDALHIRVGTYDCQLYESFDGGESFSLLGGPAGSSSTIFFTVEFDPSNFDCALCGGKGAWRTEDAGSSWTNIPPFDTEDIDLVYLFEFSPDNPQRVWARSNLETMGDNIRSILTSSDGGATFSMALAQGVQAVDQYDSLRTLILTNQPTMAARPGASDVLYVTCGSYFQNVGTSIFRYDARDDLLTVAHINGLDGIDAIAFNPADANVMYLGLESERMGGATAASESSTADRSVKVTLWPNPFNPEANIALNLPQAAHVKVDVYNLVGQKVGTVVDANLSAGEHTYSWDGSKFASGIYLLHVQAGQDTQIKKLVLLK